MNKPREDTDTDANWLSRDDYVAKLAEECRLSRGAAEAAVNDALASGHVRRRGYYSDDHRIGAYGHGEPDPGPGPSAPHLPLKPAWLEHNLYQTVEYSVADLDYETRRFRRVRVKARPKLDQETVNGLLIEKAREEIAAGKVLKDARGFLRQHGAREDQARTAIEVAQAKELIGTRGRPPNA